MSVLGTDITRTTVLIYFHELIYSKNLYCNLYRIAALFSQQHIQRRAFLDWVIFLMKSLCIFSIMSKFSKPHISDPYVKIGMTVLSKSFSCKSKGDVKIIYHCKKKKHCFFWPVAPRAFWFLRNYRTEKTILPDICESLLFQLFLHVFWNIILISTSTKNYYFCFPYVNL